MCADTYPGTAHHQGVLRAIVAHHASDPRVLAGVFGSLGLSATARRSGSVRCC